MRSRWLLPSVPFVIGLACGNGPGGEGGVAGSDGGNDATLDSSGSGDAEDASAEAAAVGKDAGFEAPAGGTDAGADTEASAPAVGASVLMYHNHINRDGYFQDPLVTANSAAQVAYDPSLTATFSDNVWTTPLYVENGVGGKGTFYVAGAGNDVYAFNETGAAAWPMKNFGKAASQSFQGGCGNVQPIGITGTPAIDLVTRLMVFDAVTGDGTAGNYIKTHTIFGVSIDDGSTKWSVDVSTLVDSAGLPFLPSAQNQRGAVLIVNGIAYVPFGGHGGDCGTYHGWVIGVPLTGTGAMAWATQVPGAGIWAPGGAASDGQSIFVSTGNGFDTSATTWQESEGVFRLDPGPTFTGNAADYFAESNWYSLDGADLDLGGSGPLVVDAPSVTPSALVLGQGKDGWLYLVDRANLGGVAAAPNTANVGALNASQGAFSGAGAWATVGGTTYVVVRPNGSENGVVCPNPSGGDMVAIKLDPTAAQKMTRAWCASSGGNGSPIITSSDGAHDGLVWVFGAEGDEKLHVFDLVTGVAVGVSDAPPLAAGAAVRHFTTLAEVKGRIFAAADDGLFAFKIGP